MAFCSSFAARSLDHNHYVLFLWSYFTRSVPLRFWQVSDKHIWYMTPNLRISFMFSFLFLVCWGQFCPCVHGHFTGIRDLFNCPNISRNDRHVGKYSVRTTRTIQEKIHNTSMSTGSSFCTKMANSFSWMKSLYFDSHFTEMFPRPNDNNPALFQITAWRRIGDKPLSEQMMVNDHKVGVKTTLGFQWVGYDYDI